MPWISSLLVLPTSCPTGGSEQARPWLACNRVRATLEEGMAWWLGACFPASVLGSVLKSTEFIDAKGPFHGPALSTDSVRGRASTAVSSYQPPLRPQATLVSGRSPSHSVAPGPWTAFTLEPLDFDRGATLPTLSTDRSQLTSILPRWTCCPGQGWPYLSGISMCNILLL